MKSVVCTLVAGGLIAAGVLGDRVFAGAAPTPSASAAAISAATSAVSTLSYDAAVEQAFKTASPSVVYVTSVGVGTGSGVIYDSTGNIVTNAHVVSGASSLTVTLGTGTPPAGGAGISGTTGISGTIGITGTTGFAGRAGRNGDTTRAGAMGGGQSSSANKQLLTYLEKNQGSTKYLFAVTSSNDAAPYIIQTGKAVMSLGGFSGNNPILTTAQLKALIKNNTVRFFLLGGQGGQGGNSTASAFVASSCKAVSSSAWQTSTTSAAGGTGAMGGMGSSQTLYDCANLT